MNKIDCKDSDSVWAGFKKALSDTLTGFGPNKLKEVWSSDAKRTAFYKTELFPKIAEQLELTYENKEYLRIDSVFYKVDSGTYNYRIPIIAVESENHRVAIGNDSGTWGEVYKLCCINAPLKIIFTVGDWNDEIKNDHITDDWNYPIDAFARVQKLVGYLGIVNVCETGGSYCFAYLVYDTKGKVVDEQEFSLGQ